MTRIFLLSILIMIMPMIHSCATAPKIQMRQDPLIGKIYDTANQQFISFSTLINNIASHDVVYLSEKHDNPMHHLVQHRIIQHLIDSKKPPTIGFEFFAMDKTPLLLNFIDSGNKAHSKKAEAFIEQDLRSKLGWDTQSDKMWTYYYDLLKLARDNNLLVAGLDLAPSQKQRITRKGMDNLTDIERQQIFSSDFSSPAYKTYMESIFKAVHCGMGHEAMQARLYGTWIARNDKMALSISQLHKTGLKGPVLVIIGGGHTEYGLGVVNRLNAINKNLSQKNIALTEIRRKPADLIEYIHPLELEGFEPVLPADFLWFTQRVSYTDPCVEFKKSLKKMKHRQK